MLGAKLEDLKLKDKKLQKPMRLGHVQASLPATLGFRVFNHHGAKEAVFPFDKLQKLPRLGNARASTVTALGLRSFPEGGPGERLRNALPVSRRRLVLTSRRRRE